MTFRADGEPNMYTVLDGKTWVASIQLNGEYPVCVQEKMMAAIVAALAPKESE